MRAIAEKLGGKVPDTMEELSASSRCRPQDRQRGARQCVPKRRRDRGGHACDPVVAAAWFNETQGRGKDRARFDEARAARALDRLESLAHLARPPPLFYAQTGLQPVRSFQVMSKRQNFPAHRPGTEAGYQMTA